MLIKTPPCQLRLFYHLFPTKTSRQIPLLESPIEAMPTPVTLPSTQTTQRAQQRAASRPRPYARQTQQSLSQQTFEPPQHWVSDPQLQYKLVVLLNIYSFRAQTLAGDLNCSAPAPLYYFNTVQTQSPLMHMQQTPQEYSQLHASAPYSIPLPETANSTPLSEYEQATLLEDPNLDMLSGQVHMQTQPSQKTLSEEDLFQMLMDNSSTHTDHGSTIF